MSVSETTEIKCPVCGHSQNFEVWGTVDVTGDEGLKQRLIDGELTTLICEQCEEESGLEQDLLYQDRDKKLMVCRLPEGESGVELLENALSLRNVMEENANENICRVVATTNDLVEKILIFDDNLDDRIVEIFKLVILGNLEDDELTDDAELFYGGLAKSEEEIPEGEEPKDVVDFLLLNEEGIMTISVPLNEEYLPLAKEISEQMPTLESGRGKWLCVDQEFAQSLMEDENE